MSNRKKPVLGRNLSSMLSQTTLREVSSGKRDELRNLPADVIRPGRYQPRSVFDEEKLAELADSIRAQGVVQPVVVRQLPTGTYQLVAGERRLRAARLAGLELVPAIVRDVDETDSFDDLPIPFRAVAADLETGDAVILDRGDLALAMRANSISITSGVPSSTATAPSKRVWVTSAYCSTSALRLVAQPAARAASISTVTRLSTDQRMMRSIMIRHSLVPRRRDPHLSD